jgi:redox-sensing transcriptional repressor
MNATSKSDIPLPSLRRLPVYYRRLQQAAEADIESISSAELARSAAVSEAQVRKDLSHLAFYGRSGVGYDVREMVAYLEEYLGLVNEKEAVLVGAGNLGRALASYSGFARYGLQILALFDSDPAKVGQAIGGGIVLPIKDLPEFARRMRVRMGILTVPAEVAQEVADAMVEGGIRVIWNFAPCILNVPVEVHVKNEDLGAELATLFHLLSRRRPAPVPSASAEGTGTLSREE